MLIEDELGKFNDNLRVSLRFKTKTLFELLDKNKYKTQLTNLKKISLHIIIPVSQKAVTHNLLNSSKEGFNSENKMRVNLNDKLD